MTLQLDPLGIYAGGTILPAQLLQRSVNGTDRLAPLHGRALHHDLRCRQGHYPRQPGITDPCGIIHHTEIMGDHVIDLNRAIFHRHLPGHRPLRIVLRLILLNITLIEINLVRIL